jgi:hypothetical protein
MSDEELDPSPRRRVTDHVPVPLTPKITEKSVITGEEIKKQLRILVILTVLLYVGFGLLLWYTLTTAQSNNNALCALRNEASTRVTEGQNFLKQHPDGAFGFTQAQLQKSVDDSIATVTALNQVDC